MKERILNKVEECFLIAEEYYARKFDRPTSIIFKRSGSSAGSCKMNYNHTQRELMFQLDLAEHNPHDAMNTVIHEVAHYIQFTVYGFKNNGIKPHGREWRYVMQRVFKTSPDVTHNYDTSVTTVKKQTLHTYTCPCNKEFQLTTTKHNRILKGQRRRCLACHGDLFLKKLGNPYEQKIHALLNQLKAKVTA